MVDIFDLFIPMPGHAILNMTETKATIVEFIEIVQKYDTLFLLTDSRESRWLPSMLGAFYGKKVMTVALGFESFVTIRHGVFLCNKDPFEYRIDDTLRESCYFCQDVIAPTNSMSERTLDQQCTISRPGLSHIASSFGVESFISYLQ
jgi:ubiquitin-like modifier-activating enzyme ATG7